jgi:polyhydroxybutyrate depolymerase
VGRVLSRTRGRRLRRVATAAVGLAVVAAACAGAAEPATTTTGTAATTTITAPREITATSAPTTSTTRTTTTTVPPATRPPPTASSAAPDGTAIEFRDVSLTVGEVERSYRLATPRGLDPASPVPLVLDLHGLTADPVTQDDLSSMSAKAAAEGFVVAQPLGLGLLPSWSAGDNSVAADDVEFLLAVVDDVAGRVAVDPARVFAGGFSNGGGMANRLACNAADTFAAVAAVSGSFVEYLDCDPPRPVPVIAFHGTRDVVVPYEGFFVFPAVLDWAQAWADRNGCAVEPVRSAVADDVELREWLGCRDGAAVALYTVEEGGHGWPGTRSADRLLNSTRSVVATDFIWDFFAAHPMPSG